MAGCLTFTPGGRLQVAQVQHHATSATPDPMGTSRVFLPIHRGRRKAVLGWFLVPEHLENSTRESLVKRKSEKIHLSPGTPEIGMSGVLSRWGTVAASGDSTEGYQMAPWHNKAYRPRGKSARGRPLHTSDC